MSKLYDIVSTMFLNNLTCRSSWAVSTASVASDRFSVKSKGLEMVDMASQQLLSCAKRQQGCTGGHLDIAWNYFRRWG